MIAYASGASVQIAPRSRFSYKWTGFWLVPSLDCNLTIESEAPGGGLTTVATIALKAGKLYQVNGEGTRTPSGFPGIQDFPVDYGFRVTASAGTLAGWIKYTFGG